MQLTQYLERQDWANQEVVLGVRVANQKLRVSPWSNFVTFKVVPALVPPPDSKDVQAKRLSPNYIENSEAPIALTQAAERFPVTLYTFACGPLCQNAEALLNRRGVPFQTVNVEEPKGAEQLQTLTGAQQAPVLQVGDKLIAKGFNEGRWTALLDEAGYPKSPSRRITAKSAPEAPAPAPASPPAEATQAVPLPGGGYPKQ